MIVMFIPSHTLLLSPVSAPPVQAASPAICDSAFHLSSSISAPPRISRLHLVRKSSITWAGSFYSALSTHSLMMLTFVCQRENIWMEHT